jgi:hypothetical protein
MKIKEIFKSTNISQSIGGLTIYLDRDNCQIVNKTKNEDSILLHLKRESDGEEGHAYLRVQDQFKNLSAKLLNWAFVSKNIIGLTLNQLEDFETNLDIENISGQIKLVD